jgi:L-ascorbate metabolism protein UlaG (beta-lactamase superfamily)
MNKTMRMLTSLLLGLATMVPGLAPAAPGETKVHWYGHASFRIETPSGGVILIDPFLNAPTNPDKESLAKLERVDCILITHGHADHVGQAVEIGKKTGAVRVAPTGCSPS